LKIHHALKETSYLTDVLNIADSAAMATTIGNYLLCALERSRRQPVRTPASDGPKRFTLPLRIKSLTVPAMSSMGKFESTRCWQGRHPAGGKIVGRHQDAEETRRHQAGELSGNRVGQPRNCQ
jgi:hypothetical protein